MIEAIRFHSWKGHCTESVSAFDVKSRSAALELGPFVDSDIRPVYWVRWGKRDSGKYIKPYFKHWPKTGKGGRIFTTFKVALMEREKTRETPLHRKAKRVCAEVLTEWIQAGKELPWAFKNPEVSDFPMCGDLLSGVDEAREEYPMDTPFGDRYRFDVALITTKAPFKKPLVLGAIEFEFTSKLSIWKTVVCKAMGFPIVSIDLDTISEEDITKEWIIQVLTETTATNEEGRRRNFFFIHSMLYPLYLDISDRARVKHRHQFIVFAADEILYKFKKWLEELSERFGFSKTAVMVQIQSGSSDQAKMIMRHEGSMAGHDWAEYNSKKYLRITLGIPKTKNGLLYLYHLALARLFCQTECLVGYKYEMGTKNVDLENPLWTREIWDEATKTHVSKLIAPKHLSQPLRPLLKFLDSVERDKRTPTPAVDISSPHLAERKDQF